MKQDTQNALDQITLSDDDFGDFETLVSPTELANKTNKGLQDFDEDLPGAVTSLDTVKQTVPKEIELPTPKPKTPEKEKAKPKAEDKTKSKDNGEDDDEDEENEEDLTDDDFDFSTTKPQPAKGKEAGKKGATAPNTGDVGDEKVGDDKEDETQTFTEFAKGLKERGILTIDVPDEVDEDGLFELQEQEFNARLDETISKMAEDMGPDGKDLIKYVINGGKVQDFVEVYAQNSFPLEEFDPENKKHVQAVLQYYIENYEDVDEDEVEDRIKFINESGKAAEKAGKFFKAIKADEEKTKLEFNKAQAKKVEDRQKAAKILGESVAKTLKGVEQIGVFPIAKTEHQKIVDYVNKPTIKVGKNTFIPPLIAQIRQTLSGKTDEDLKNLIILGKLYMTNFSPDDIITEVQTEVAKKVKNGIAAGKLGFKIKGGGSGVKKSLLDYFPEE